MAEVQEPAAGAIAFEILAEIAVGATSRVDLCRALPPHARKGQLLAVKRLHPHIAEDPSFANQFFDEVWMTGSLRHPNVVEVAGWGTDQQGGYLAVELVQGVSLQRLEKTVFETGEVFSERMVVFIASRICRGLAAAHALRAPDGELLNLVHRDLTPGNILVGFNGDVKIADFGLAKAKQRLTKTLTGMRKGEPTYMAPEQALSDVIDGRADVFSLGVMLFELFAGRRPWIAKSDYEMVQITTREPPADLRELRPKIDKELVNVVNRCLEKDPGGRFQSAREIADRFDEWLSVHGYVEANEEALGRFVRRNAMRQMRWFERAITGELAPKKVGRELPPRVPTYTEQTDRPPEPRSQPKTAPDDRQQRAANAVRELKKFAPPPPVPKVRARTPTLDEEEDGDETDVTDVELRIASAQQGGAPKIVDAAGDSDDGEEMETLVQKGSHEIEELRAGARKKASSISSTETIHDRGRGVQIPSPPGRAPAAQVMAKRVPGAPIAGAVRIPKPPYSPLPIADEDSDQQITDVKNEKRRGERRPDIQSPDSEELPTHPIRQPARAVEPLPARRGGPEAGPAKGVIPGGPGIPQFTGGNRAAPRGPAAPRAPRSEPPPPRAAPITTRPPPPAPPPPPPASVAPPPSSDAHTPLPVSSVREVRSINLTDARERPSTRTSSPDDVIVIDRRDLQGRDVHGQLTEEALIVEADRLAIEAVRRSEEAKAAAARAERKAQMAKMAADAAMIASDAVQLVRTAGLAAALQRIEEARAIELALQSGKFPVGEPPRPPSIPAPPSDPGRGLAYAPPAPGTPSGLVAVGSPAGLPPPPHAQSHAQLAVPPPRAQATGPQGQVFEPNHGGYAQSPASASPVGGFGSAQPAHDGGFARPPARPMTAAPPLGQGAGALGISAIDAEAFRAQLKPAILGMPTAVVACLAGAALAIAVLLAYLLLG